MVRLVRRAVEENGRRDEEWLLVLRRQRGTLQLAATRPAQHASLAAAQLGAGSGSCLKAQAQLEKRRQALVSRSFSCRA